MAHPSTRTRPHARRVAAIVGALAVTLAGVAGCGVDNPTPTPAAAPSSTPPTTAPATTAAPSPTTPPADAMTKMGTRADVRDGIADGTVFSYRQPVAQSAPRPDGQPGYTWGAADVRVCATKTAPEPILVSNGPWALVYADDTTAEASSVGYQQFPKPGYPFGEKIVPQGRCVRGWITFPVPAKLRPVAIEYAPEGELMPVRWAVK